MDYSYFETQQASALTLEESKADKYKQTNEINLKKAQQANDLNRTNDEAARNRKKAKYDLIKSTYSDPDLLKMEYLRA